jgi:microcystin-dependent protein
VALAIGDIPGNLAEVILVYNLANTRWELVNPPAVPVGGTVPFFGGTVPAGFALPQGQNLSAATFPAANAVLGTTWGSPGGGNFTMPDHRGRKAASLDAGGSGRISVAGGNFDGTVLQGGGAQNQTLSTAQLPVTTPSVSGTSFSGTGQTNSLNQNTGFLNIGAGGTQANVLGGGGGPGDCMGSTVNWSFGQMTVTTTAVGTVGVSMNSFGSGGSHPTIDPTIMCNVMMRVA